MTMTLTDDRRTRATSRPARTDAPALQTISSAPATRSVAPAPPEVRPRLVVEFAREDVYRVLDGSVVVGYVQIAGPVFVTLLGGVYNTSIEIAQCLELDLAVARLECHRA
jgi:hypothetical protein